MKPSAVRSLIEHSQEAMRTVFPMLSVEAAHMPVPRPGRPLKVGFVSPNLYAHSTGKVLAGVIGRLAERPDFEVRVCVCVLVVVVSHRYL